LKPLEEYIQQVDFVFRRATQRVARSSIPAKERKYYVFKGGETYLADVKTYIRWAYEKYGVTDFHFHRTNHAEVYITQKMADGHSPYSIFKIVHALAKYQAVLRHQYKYRARIIAKGRVLEEFKKLKFRRRAAEVRKSRKINLEQAQMITGRIAQSKSPNASIFSKVAEFQMMTGSRVTAALRIKRMDIDFENYTVTFVKDKGGRTRTVKVDKNYMEQLEQQVGNYSPRRPIFEIRQSSGRQMALRLARLEYQRVYRNAAIKCGLTGASTHSQRKAYAQSQYEGLLMLSWHALREELVDEMSGDPKLRIKERIKKQTRTINRQRITRRRLTREEMARLIVSIHLGHNRLDVMRFYIVRSA
jgi:hypothetical protein